MLAAISVGLRTCLQANATVATLFGDAASSMFLRRTGNETVGLYDDSSLSSSGSKISVGEEGLHFFT